MTIQVSNRQTAKKQMRVEVSMMGNVMQKTVVNQTKVTTKCRDKKWRLKGRN